MIITVTANILKSEMMKSASQLVDFGLCCYFWGGFFISNLKTQLFQHVARKPPFQLSVVLF